MRFAVRALHYLFWPVSQALLMLSFYAKFQQKKQQLYFLSCGCYPYLVSLFFIFTEKHPQPHHYLTCEGVWVDGLCQSSTRKAQSSRILHFIKIINILLFSCVVLMVWFISVDQPAERKRSCHKRSLQPRSASVRDRMSSKSGTGDSTQTWTLRW